MFKNYLCKRVGGWGWGRAKTTVCHKRLFKKDKFFKVLLVGMVKSKVFSFPPRYRLA